MGVFGVCVCTCQSVHFCCHGERGGKGAHRELGTARHGERTSFNQGRVDGRGRSPFTALPHNTSTPANFPSDLVRSVFRKANITMLVVWTPRVRAASLCLWTVGRPSRVRGVEGWRKRGKVWLFVSIRVCVFVVFVCCFAFIVVTVLTVACQKVATVLNVLGDVLLRTQKVETDSVCPPFSVYLRGGGSIHGRKTVVGCELVGPLRHRFLLNGCCSGPKWVVVFRGYCGCRVRHYRMRVSSV